MSDQYDFQAEQFVPCHKLCQDAGGVRFHSALCLYGLRPRIAGALREAGKREADLRREVELILAESKHGRCVHASSYGPLDCVFCAPWVKRNADLRREVERLKEKQVRLEQSYAKALDAAAGDVIDLRREVARLELDSIVRGEMYEDAMDEVRALKEKLAEYLVAYRLEDKP